MFYSVVVIILYYVVQVDADIRRDRFVGKAGSVCTPKCPNACEEYNFSSSDYIKYGRLLSEEIKGDSNLRSGWEAAINLKKSHSKLLPNETLAVVTYTLENPNVYQPFNKATRELGINSQDYHYKGFHFFLSSAVHKLSDGRINTVYRCIDFEITVNIGDTFNFKQFASTTRKQDLLFADFCFKISTSLGARIALLSEFPKEDEVLIPSCESFNVKAVSPKGPIRVELETKAPSPSSNTKNMASLTTIIVTFFIQSIFSIH